MIGLVLLWLIALPTGISITFCVLYTLSGLYAAGNCGVVYLLAPGCAAFLVGMLIGGWCLCDETLEELRAREIPQAETKL